jgi:hypothetical protein
MLHAKLDVGKAPAQSHGYDQNYGEHTEISGLSSSRRGPQYFRDHLDFALKLLRGSPQRTLTRTTGRRLSKIDHVTHLMKNLPGGKKDVNEQLSLGLNAGAPSV